MTYHPAHPCLTGRLLVAWIMAVCVVCLQPSLADGDLIWESHYLDEEAILDGSTLVTGGTTITFSRTVFSDSDGGTFDLVPDLSTDFFSFEGGLSGNHAGHLEMTFNNENNDPADYLELTMSFSGPVTNLGFSILDVDFGPFAIWDDGVEVFFNGINVKTDPSLFTVGPAVALDTKSYMDGFEGGATTVAANDPSGNIDLQFGAIPISNITIRYFATDDALGDPFSQFIGISDMAFVAAIPEPTIPFVFLTMLLGGAAFRTRRSRKPGRRHC